MTRIRPTEFKAVLALISAPAESEEELATRVIETLDELRSQRTDYVTVVQYHPTAHLVYGPYTTIGYAERDLKNLPWPNDKVKWMCLPLTTCVLGVEIDPGIVL